MALASVPYRWMTCRTTFVLALDACALCVPTSTPLLISSPWVVASLCLVLFALIPVSLGAALARAPS